MRISNKGIRLIKFFEGCKLAAYPDPASGGKPWTIGYGHTHKVKRGDTITQPQAEQFLYEDLETVCSTIEKSVKAKINQTQFDALCSFIFDVGASNFINSTLLKKLNAGDINGAGDELIRWNRAAGKVIPGLTKRREAERALFLS